MKYLNAKSLDLEQRLHYELTNTKYPKFCSFQINQNWQRLITQILRDKNKQVTLLNVTTYALTRLFDRYRKKHNTYFKYVLLATYSEKTLNIYIHGIAFTNHPQSIELFWNFGDYPEASPIISNGAFIKFFVKKYIYSKENHRIYNYTSQNFGLDFYKTPLYNILRTNKIDFMSQEYFRQIPYFQNYFISKNAIVLSRQKSKPKILKTYRYNSASYVKLSINRKSKAYKVVNLMAKTYFKTDCLNKPFKIIHLNSDKFDNSLNNLYLMKSA